MNNVPLYQRRDIARKYDNDRFGGAFGNHLENIEIETYGSLMDSDHSRILDAGAGTGKLSVRLRQKSLPVTSIDASREMLDITIAKGKTLGLTVDAAVCDVHDMCFTDGAFDCVLASRILMHLRDWRRGIGELCRVSNRLVIIDFPVSPSFGALESVSRNLCHRLRQDVIPYNVFRFGAVRQEFEKSDFQIVDVRRECFMPMAFHRRLNNPEKSIAIEKWFAKLRLISLFGSPVTTKAVKNQREESRRKPILTIGGLSSAQAD